MEAESSPMAAAILSAPFFWFSALWAISLVVCAICSAVADSSREPLDTPSTLSPTVDSSAPSCLTIRFARKVPSAMASRMATSTQTAIVASEAAAVASFFSSCALAVSCMKSFIASIASLNRTLAGRAVVFMYWTPSAFRPAMTRSMMPSTCLKYSSIVDLTASAFVFFPSLPLDAPRNFSTPDFSLALLLSRAPLYFCLSVWSALISRSRMEARMTTTSSLIALAA